MTVAEDANTRTYAENAKYQKSWYWYDWANSAFVTTTQTVLFGPFITAIAKSAACPGIADDADCTKDVHFLGIPIAAGSVSSFTTTVATIISFVVLIAIGPIADRSQRPARLLGTFAFLGAIPACLLFFVTGDHWLFGVVLMVLSTSLLGGSLVVYNSILCRIAAPDDRDRVSSRGWAWGYLGGGLLLAVNLGMLQLHDKLGLSTGMAARVSLLSAGLWWAAFTLVPVIGMWSLRGTELTSSARATIASSWNQLVDTAKDLKNYPHTRMFLLAYLFFNDGIQTVINSASIYGSEELKFSTSQLFELILMVQFVAFGGALLFGRFAARYGAYKTVLWSLAAWIVIVALAYPLPAGSFMPFVALGVGIGIVLGGSQALSRSLFSQLIPARREAEYFSFYQAMERGTSWFGTLTFGVVYQMTHSYRYAIVALIIFFVLGGWLLRKVDVRQGILDAGNVVPKIV